MERNFKKFLLSPRIVILIMALLFSVYAIAPQPFQNGVIVTSILPDSSAAESGLTIDTTAKPSQKEIILFADQTELSSAEDFYESVQSLPENTTVRLETSNNVYRIVTPSAGSLGIEVKDAPVSNIRKGLDLEGGTQVFLQPEKEVSEDTLDEAVKSLKLRLNVYGLSDITVRKISNPSQFIIVEIAGATQQEVRDLLASQGKFEAKIGNDTVFKGNSVRFVSRDARNARVEQCSPSGTGYFCRYSFGFIISEDAAKRFADATASLDIIDGSLSRSIDFFLDDTIITNLSIAAELKGRAITNPSIQGSEVGPSQQDAYAEAQREMNRLQTIIETGSLPVKLNIVRASTISPALGLAFANNAILVGLLAILSVALVCFLFFRSFKIVIPMIFTMLSEIVLLLGLSAMINWQLDLAAIAGIIIAAGTGVDDQIVITHELLRGEGASSYNWKRKIKRAFFIIMAAYFTTLVAMFPLWWAGAGLLKGFAFITIAGISFGVFITRPAYAKAMEFLLQE